jgi:hypothetical protein
MNQQTDKPADSEIVTMTVGDLAERFEVSVVPAGNGDALALEAFRDLLAARLRLMIDEQFSRLAPLLYRIDVDEARVDEILRRAPFSEVPTRLADLIIERRLQAMRTRQQYRSE